MRRVVSERGVVRARVVRQRGGGGVWRGREGRQVVANGPQARVSTETFVQAATNQVRAVR